MGDASPDESGVKLLTVFVEQGQFAAWLLEAARQVTALNGIGIDRSGHCLRPSYLVKNIGPPLLAVEGTCTSAMSHYPALHAEFE